MAARKWINLAIVIAIALLAWSPAQQGFAQASPPGYQLQYLGAGTPVALNSSGVVAGRELISGTSNYRPLVSVNGAPWAALPVPAGAMSVFPMDINDSGVIVGVSFSPQWYPAAVRWTPSGSGYTLQELPRLPGDTSAYATGINNLGQVVGSRGALGYTPNSTGWLLNTDGSLVDLSAQYGLVPYPRKINDLGQILAGAELLDLTTGSVSWIGDGPTNYNAVTGVDINDNGLMVGAASLRSSSLNIMSVFRFKPGLGWEFIDGSSKYTAATNINNRGDIGYGELGAGLYLDGLGKFALGSLLDPAVTAAGWAITGSGAIINDARMVAAVGRNSTTGQSGGVLLTPTNTLPPPTAPANLQGTAHPATASEPFNAINLTWENTSTLSQGYELARSLNGAGSWTILSLTPPGTATNHTDTTIEAGATYDYRVRAVGLGGASAWSNTITVTAPAAQDTTPPVVSIQTPANGANISGTVTVTAQASDNVAVEYLELSFWNQYTGQQVIIGSVSKSGSLTVSWNTSGLTPAAYTLRAYAYDALNNWSQAEISVNVGSQAKMLKVTGITLGGTVRQSTASITADITVKDSAGRAVSSAAVNIRWTRPNGTTQTATANTNSLGRVRFTTSGSRGTYTISIVNVTKTGYSFDSAGSVLTRSITK